MNKKIYVLTVAVLLVIAIGAYFFPWGRVVTVIQNGDNVGAAGTRFPNGITTGANGTDNVEIAARTCNLAIGNPNVAMSASTTRWFSCTGITGVTSTDLVFGMLPGILDSRTNYAGAFSVVAINASSTAGAVDVALFWSGVGNNTSTSSFSQATTSFRVLYFDTTRD